MPTLPLFLLACLPLAFQRSAPPERPRLVVILSIDQMIPEQLRRLEPAFTGGFRRLLDEGCVFWHATVDYAATETGPGHATLATGRFPSNHGIVGNLFLDAATGQVAYCVGDGAQSTLTGQGETAPGVPGISPANLLGDGLADILAAQVPGSKCLTIAGKDRSAVLLGGQHPLAALWWNGGGGGFAGSTWYGAKLPEFVGVWNSAWRERARGWKWECSVEGDLARLGTARDDRPGEVGYGGRSLPRTLPEDDAALPPAVLNSPLVDYFTLELAMLGADAEGLGKDEATDYLGIGLSACDILGHGYGPTSVEVTDLLMRDDRDLGRFFEYLDETVGEGRWVACLSADHGVLPLPEGLQESGVGARRIDGAAVQAMVAHVQETVNALHPEVGELGVFELGFRFDEARARAAGIEPADLRALIAEAGRETDWIADAYTREDLEGTDTADPWLVLYRRSYFPERSADVVLRPDPWLIYALPLGTSHGSPYPYDRGVPLAFLGAGVHAGDRYDAVSTVDAVPTLLGLLGLQPPEDLDGHALALD